MFVQVIEAHVRDAEGLRRQMEEWQEHLAPQAVGWLGSTSGVTPDGHVIVAARFESAEAAAANAARPEQSQWWAVTEKALEDVTFAESSDIRVLGACGDDAGFVQVMRSHPTDRARVESLDAQMERVADFRPDLMGGYSAWMPDGELVSVNYFTSEAAARAGEAREMPDDLAATFADWDEVMGETRWFDLPDPWLTSPA